MAKANTYPDLSLVKFYGEDAGGNFGKGTFLPPKTISQSSAPSSVVVPNSIGSAFGGDTTCLMFGVGKSISGANTLGQPASGYLISTENSLNFSYLSNSSGYNSSTGGNGGRTGVAAHYIKVDNYGQGDAIGVFVNAFVMGSKPGATHFLANPAGGLFAGQALAGQDGVYLNPVEITLNDQGFDVAGINFVANLSRSNDTGALGTVWMGYRSQSKGVAAIDAHFSAVGKSKIGLDLSGLVTNQSGAYTNAAIVLKSMDRIYFNGSPGVQPGYAVSSGLDGSYLWVEAGALKYKGSSGTVTILGAS